MATTLTDDDIQAIANQVYQMILAGSANSLEYKTVIEAPTEESEQLLWSIPAIKNAFDSDNRSAGNINLRAVLVAFGSEAMSQNTIAAANIETMLAYKDAAGQSAYNAQSAEEVAASKALEASGYASNAEEAKIAAVNAKTAAETAKDDAEEAKTDAETAKAAAESAEAGAEAAEGNALNYKTAAETALSQINAVAQTKTVLPISIEGNLIGLTISIDEGQPYLSLNEINTTDDTTTDIETA